MPAWEGAVGDMPCQGASCYCPKRHLIHQGAPLRIRLQLLYGVSERHPCSAYSWGLSLSTLVSKRAAECSTACTSWGTH